MGLKPTQYRCASESLLRRLRREGDLPSLHPLVDLCNAVSAAFAIPVAALDADRISGDLEVRRAAGAERYDTFTGDVEHPEPGEVVFVDAAGRAHARRWTNRQSGHSAISAATRRAFIVTEALHEDAAADVTALLDAPSPPPCAPPGRPRPCSSTPPPRRAGPYPQRHVPSPSP